MEVHDTHSPRTCVLFFTIPAKEARCLEAGRRPLLSSCGRPCRALLPCGQPPACFCWQRVSLRHQRGRTTSSGTDFLTQLSGRMVDFTKVYWSYTTFRRRTAWIPEVCSVGLAKAYPETGRAGGAFMVHYDKLVDAMRHDALFKDCKWSTCVPYSTGSTHVVKGCMTLCDSGYHEWQETMNGYKYPTTCAEGLWSAR